MNTKLIDLRPERDLLDPAFNGYKLSLENIPSFEEKLSSNVDRVIQTSDQFSFLHAKLFSLHNHLIGDPYSNGNSVYFIDKLWHVQKPCLMDTNKINKITQVYTIPNKKKRQPGDYNISLQFASDSLAVISDGIGHLYILNTGLRKHDDLWNLLYCNEVIGSGKKFVIQDALYTKVNDKHELHCLLLSIEQENSNDKYSTVLHWITLLEASDNSWSVLALRELRGKDGIYYACLEPDCNSIYIVSNSGLKFTTDSENPISNTEENIKEIKKLYFWIQTKEDITLKLKMPENFCKDDIFVEVKSKEIIIKYKNKCLLIGNLAYSVDSELTTWTVVNHLLEIILIKTDHEQTWTMIVDGDDTGEEILDSAIIEEAHERLAHFCLDSELTTQQCPNGSTFNSQQIEECDFEDDATFIFERLNRNTHEVTHRCNMGSHNVLLTVRISDNLPPALAVRHDVDACIWQPQGSGENWTLKHHGTLFAFGYVQASKRQKKFLACAPDLSYSVVCESSHHLFIYRQSKSLTGGELRHRTTGKRIETTAQQQVISLPNEEILGLWACNTVLYLLTETSIVTLQLQ